MELLGLPTELLRTICIKVKPIHIVGKGLDGFLIKECYLDEPDKLLYALVKRRCYVGLGVLVGRHTARGFHKQTIKTCLALAARTSDVRALYILTRIVDGLEHEMVLLVIHRLCKVKDDEAELDRLLRFIDLLPESCKKSMTCSSRDVRLIVDLLAHPFSTRIVVCLLRNKLLNSIIGMEVEDEHCDKLVKALVTNNHVLLLKGFVQRGYVITVTDVVVALARSDADMVAYVMKHFKPRMFSANFRHWMLRIAHIRNDPRMSKLVDRKLTEPKKRVAS